MNVTERVDLNRQPVSSWPLPNEPIILRFLEHAAGWRQSSLWR